MGILKKMKVLWIPNRCPRVILIYFLIWLKNYTIICIFLLYVWWCHKFWKYYKIRRKPYLLQSQTFQYGQVALCIVFLHYLRLLENLTFCHLTDHFTAIFAHFFNSSIFNFHLCFEIVGPANGKIWQKKLKGTF